MPGKILGRFCDFQGQSIAPGTLLEKGSVLEGLAHKMLIATERSELSPWNLAYAGRKHLSLKFSLWVCRLTACMCY